MEWMYLIALVFLVALVGAGLMLRGTKKLKGSPQPKGYVPSPKATPLPMRPLQVRSSQEIRAKPIVQPVINENEEKMNRLAIIVDGDACANRMVAWVQEKHPDKPRLWCIEKAIEDAERDRR